MSLKVWLPLVRDLSNQGLLDTTFVNTNVTIDDSGKLGKCYYFNGSAYLKETSIDWTNFNTSEFSLCCWYKQPSPVASGNSQMICIGTSSGWGNIRIGLLRRASNGYPMFSVSNGTNYVGYNFTATSFTLDTWNHIACTYKDGLMSMYINGVLDKTYTTTIVPVLNSSQHLGIGGAYNGAEKLTGYLNDVRIYDHALSQKEIKLLSQGLVAHYKLTSPLVSEDTTVYDSSGYNNHMLAVGSPTVTNTSPKYADCTHFIKNQYAIATENSNTGWLPTDSITINFWANITTWGNPISCTESGGWNIEDAGSGNGIRFSLYVKNKGYVYKNSGVTPASLLNAWHMFTCTFDQTYVKLYIDSELKSTAESSVTNVIYYSAARFCLAAEAQGVSPANSNMVGDMSDVRIYATALSPEDILELYHTGQSISDKKELFAYEFKEPTNGELMNVAYSKPYSNHNPSTSPYTDYDSNGNISMVGNCSMGSVYIPINPSGKKYYYDILFSASAGNQFDIGFERYDANKTPRSNNACIYVYAVKSVTDVVKKRIRGIVDLSTDTVNPCAFIALRVLNGWSGSDSSSTKEATIYYISLREVDGSVGFHTSFGKNGVVTTDLLLEPNGTGDIEKTGIINMTQFYEL